MAADEAPEAVEERLRVRIVAGHQRYDHHSVALTLRDGFGRVAMEADELGRAARVVGEPRREVPALPPIIVAGDVCILLFLRASGAIRADGAGRVRHVLRKWAA